jgi:UDP-N-acetylmuramyl pentapeptide phosphotransferase/UDP-N-acetylglucosamine-1-phosphate transferase
VTGSSALRSALAFAAARGAGRGLAALLRAHPPGGTARWDRRNHRGVVVTLLEGPTAALAAAVGSLPAVTPLQRAGVVAAVGAGAFGALDDLTERVGDRDAGARGFRGHLAALRRGRMTTGAWKVLGIGATGLASAVLVDRPRTPVQLVGTLLGGALVAGSANLLNLFDLRPGRAAKVAAVAAASLAVGAPGSRGASLARPCAAAVLGACSAVLPDDLAGRSMLGDTGANALGGVLGVAALARWGRPGRTVALGAVIVLTVLSERVSFSEVIEGVPLLRELDRLGRS